jgi:sugar phosphate isomerase/epimerase
MPRQRKSASRTSVHHRLPRPDLPITAHSRAGHTASAPKRRVGDAPEAPICAIEVQACLGAKHVLEMPGFAPKDPEWAGKRKPQCRNRAQATSAVRTLTEPAICVRM